MSAEVSFTKRAAAELSRCFNGLTNANRNNNSNNNNNSNSNSTTSSPSHSSSTRSRSSTPSTSINSTNGHQNEQDTSETSLLLPPTNSNDSFTNRSTLSNISILNTSSRSGKKNDSQSTSSSFHNSVQTLITKANTTLSPLTHHRESTNCKSNHKNSNSNQNSNCNSGSNLLSSSPSASSVCKESSSSSISLNSPAKRSIASIASRAGIASGTPPTPPRKTSLARRKNFMLNLSKARTLEELSKDLSFLTSFFHFFTSKELTVLAQVCTYWRDLLYSDPSFWQGLIMVINCNDLRRSSPITRINNGSNVNNLTSTTNTVVNNGKISIMNQSSGNLSSLNQNPPTESSSSSPTTTTSTSSSARNINTSNNNNNNNNNNHNHNQRKSSVDKGKNKKNLLNGNLDTQIDVNRCIRDSLYSSIEQRGIDSICLIGPMDSDVIDFSSKLAPSRMKRIKHGSLKSASISDKGLEIFLASLNQSLISLELIGCNELTDTGLWTSLVPSLQSLTIMDCINVADETVAAVAQMLPSLKEFNLQAYHVTDSAMSYFGPTSARNNLRVLRLEHCWEIGNQGILSIAHGLPNLTAISLSGCSKITDDAIEVIAEQLRHLKSLNLSWCPRISDASLEYIACDLADSLTELNLDRCVHITDIGLGYAATMAKLNVLSLRWCPQVRDFGIQTLCSMKSLTSLALAGCPQLTVNGLSCLAQMHNLKELELTNCPAATPELIRYLYDHMPRETDIII